MKTIKLLVLACIAFLSVEHANAQEYSQVELIAKVNAMGYKPYQVNNAYFIKSKTCIISLDMRTFFCIYRNANYISELDKNQANVLALKHQTAKHNIALSKYLAIYNLKRSRMSSSDINAWRALTANANLLGDKIYAIDEQYEGQFNFTPFDKLATSQYSAFVDNINASNAVLGQ